MQTFTRTVFESPSGNGDYLVNIPDEIIAALDLEHGDTLDCVYNEDGSISFTPTHEFVMVECLQTFLVRYLVKVPKGKKEWALDDVTMETAEEHSQKFIGEQISDHYVVTRAEAETIRSID